MEEWKLGSACAPSRSAAGSPSTSADFNLGPGPKLKFDGENFNFGPGPRLKSKSVKIAGLKAFFRYKGEQKEDSLCAPLVVRYCDVRHVASYLGVVHVAACGLSFYLSHAS